LIQITTEGRVPGNRYPARHLHHKAGAIGAGNSAEDHKYLASVAAALTDAGAILIVGPSSAKTELVKHLHRHDPKTAERVVGIETSDHPSDGQIVAHARVYFRAADRMTPQRASDSPTPFDGEAGVGAPESWQELRV
jgi:hypothetical protein